MNCHKQFSYIVYALGLISFIFIFYYAYQNQRVLLPIFIKKNLNTSVDNPFKRNNFSTSNPLVKYIEQCPECFLFLLTNKSLPKNVSILHILNQISISTQAVFYPLTMKLQYNQPIPFYTILSNNQTETTINVRNYWINSINNYSNIKQDSILNLILRSLQKPIKTINYSWPNETKLILYYTKFFGNTYWYNSNEREVYLNDLNPAHCPISVNSCYVTTDHKLFSQSDAVLIHPRESINYKQLQNKTRQPNQRFVFFIKESPIHSPVLSSQQHGQLFNYTQTYRPDSDLTATTLTNLFWLFDHKIYPDYDLDSILVSKISGHLAVAIISNCGGSSNRLQYIKELRKYMSVDVYGGCGQRCPPGHNCRQFAYSTYKFYLAFENSLCEEYVTEKFFTTVESARIVPVVLGLARYDHYIPTNAYIDIRNFTTPRELAAYMNYLDKNTTAYLEYFQWRQYALPIKVPRYICELCLKLFLDDKDNKQQSLEKIDQYWNKNTQCHKLKINQNGTWIIN